MVLEFIEQLFSRSPKSSRSTAKDRLKFVLAYDRAQLSPDTLESMCEEIMDVLSKYVELDREGFEFNLASESGTTALIANFPIRRVKSPAAIAEDSH